MVIMKRQSGSWKNVVQTLGQKGIHTENLSDLPKLLEIQKQNYIAATSIFEREQSDLDKSFNAALEKLSSEHKLLAEAIPNKFNSKIKSIDDGLDIIRRQERDFNAQGFWFKLVRLGKKTALIRAKNRLQAQRKKLLLKQELELKGQEKIYDDKRKRITRKNCDYRDEIEKKVKIVQEKITAIEQVLNSGTYHGASAELRMIEFLRKLPDNYVVVNDVVLRLKESVYFDNTCLSTAQIDHLVIGPAGIFVIEVKNWSKKFTSDGDFFDPYKQVKRHNYVCYKFLKKQFEVKVRNIIAYASHIPEKPDDSFVKVLPLEQVNSYIMWFKEVKHDADTVQRIVRVIEKEIDIAN